MRNLFPALLLILLVACNTIDYDSETRLVVVGQITNNQDIALQNIPVRLTVFDTVAKHQDVITYGVSDASGNFKLVFPGPKNINNLIRFDLNNTGNTGQNTAFDSIPISDFSNYKLDLGQIRI